MGLDLVQVAATQEVELTWPGEMAGGGALFFLPSPNPNFQEALLAMAAGTYSEKTNGPSSLLFLVKSSPATPLSWPHRPSHATSRSRVSFRCL